MGEANTRFIRYLYLDVVSFTEKRSVEAQTEIVGHLNEIVRATMGTLPLQPERIIFLPTGDGLGIAIVDELAAYDIHLQFALRILGNVGKHNSQVTDDMRKFEVRIGLSQNIDNLITDINGSNNVAGHGINTAQRVMSVADGSNVLVSQSVYDTLSHREQYMKHFRRFEALIKHGMAIAVYQYIDSRYDGLSATIPKQFERKTPEDKKLSLYEAYYIGHVIQNLPFTMANASGGQTGYALTAMYHFMAEDSVQMRTRSQFDPPLLHLHGGYGTSLEASYKYYMSIDFSVCEIVKEYAGRLLEDCYPFFEKPFLVVNEKGRKKLKEECADIWSQLGIKDA